MQNKSTNRNCRVAVIGAGVAGLTAAHTLKKLGYNHVTIFEKESEVGGKVNTHFHDGRAYEMGAVWFTTDYRTVIRLAKEFGVPKMRARNVNYMKNDGTQIDTLHLVSELGGLPQVLAAVYSFMKTLRQFPELKKPGFVGANPQLHLSMEQFSEKRHFLLYTRIVSSIMTGCGYGFYREIPALYWLKLMPMINNIFLRGLIPLHHSLWSFPGGFQHLWTKVAADLDVRLDSPVSGITESGKGSARQMIITTGGKDHEFDRVILTSPLDRSHEIKSLDPEERDLFQRIRHLRYAITLAKTNNSAHAGVIDHVTPDKVNHVNFIAKYYEDTDISIFYQMLDKDISEAGAKKALTEDLALSGIKINKILAQKSWSYFPHVRQMDLDAGFYARLDALQGHRGTYYAGGMLNFETVEHTASHAEYLVKRFFAEA